MLTLTLREPTVVPLEAECLSPDVLAPLTHAEVRALPVMRGKRQLRLDDVFDVDGVGSDDVELRGDLGRVKWVGRAMTRGRVRILGNAGMHLGAYMTGGSIEVTGNASDWVGGEMAGGTIRVRGNAGGQLGSAYRGSMSGMSGGSIVVDGAAGIELGMRMKRGLIAVRGPVRDFAGLQMKGGTIVLMSGAELRTGAWMQRGTIISLKPLRLLPTFAFACEYRPSFLPLYAKHLAALGVELPADGTYRRFAGDAAVPGKGELLVWHGG
ncbi:formylmethanofuran dehydrogenase subunit C [Urbifossiella limnaea]|uniref:Formyltransferase/hydrolase complex Fhc subunit C n=1 Tax=Urbifossiella limnaea TaxID=2528023 RepID=A0A517XZC1_9BACT|nr:formylmethanofuran dehydrogenase subunit C [Urbifossiella limnaea]QDU22857.1 Formyltransferase/hydrolase complex Fhc subunit C [Urbifossiella limnaea]